MPWRRSDVGFELGAMTVNIMVTFGLIVVALVVAATVVPVVLYPVSYTLWQALDLAMRPPEKS
jgi:hypothetical protein